jgi:Zn-dependent protease with chaperone function
VKALIAHEMIHLRERHVLKHTAASIVLASITLLLPPIYAPIGLASIVAGALVLSRLFEREASRAAMNIVGTKRYDEVIRKLKEMKGASVKLN